MKKATLLYCGKTKDFPHETLRNESAEHTCQLLKGHKGKHRCVAYSEYGDFGVYRIPCGKEWR